MNSQTLNLVRANYDVNLKIKILLFNDRNFLGKYDY